MRATATMALGLPKIGLQRGVEVVGDLYLADISIPLEVYERLGLTCPLVFERSPIIRLKNETSLAVAGGDGRRNDPRFDQSPAGQNSCRGTRPRVSH